MMKRLVLAGRTRCSRGKTTPNEANMRDLMGELRALKNTKEDKECRTKVYERHANVPVE